VRGSGTAASVRLRPRCRGHGDRQSLCNGLGCLVIVFLPWVSALLLLGVGLVGGCGLLRLDRAHVDADSAGTRPSRSRACGMRRASASV